MKKGAPYISFAVTFREFLREKDYQSPSEFFRDLTMMMGRHAPSQSSIWMSFYGERLLPIEAVEFMRQRMGFKTKWTDFLPTEKPRGATQSHNQLALPGMRETKEIGEAQRRAIR